MLSRRQYIAIIATFSGWTFFAISYGEDLVSGNRSMSPFFEGGGSLLANISQGRGPRPPTTVGVKKLEWLPFRVVSKYPPSLHHLVLSQYTHLTERQTDRQTELRQQYRELHYMQLHGKNTNIAFYSHMMTMKFHILVCAEELENSFSLGLPQLSECCT